MSGRRHSSAASILVSAAPFARSVWASRLFALASLVLIAAFTLVPAPPATTIESHGAFFSGDLGLQDFIANVVLFLPLGIALALLKVEIHVGLLLAFLVSFSVEMLQFYAVPGRDASTADLTANSLGGALGALLTLNAYRMVFPGRRAATFLCVFGMMSAIGLLSVSTWLSELDVPGRRFLGQWSGGAWPGAKESTFGVVRASANGINLPWGRVPMSADLSRRAASGELHLDVLGVIGPPNGPVTRVLGIFETGPEWGIEMAVLERWGPDLMFVPRARAERFLLRSPWMRVSDVFPAGVRDTIQVIADATSSTRRVVVRSRRGETMRSLPAAMGGWMLVVPKSLTPSGYEGFLGVVWLFLLFGPPLYWSGRVVLLWNRRRRGMPASAGQP